jgi:hypothetical protein
MANPFVHIELNTPDLAKSKEFYGAIAGWTFTDNDMGGMIYSMFKPDSGPGGGMMTVPGAPTQWLGYIGVEDINASTTQATSLGATLLRGPHEVPGHGWMSILIDPTGAPIALWQDTSTK